MKPIKKSLIVLTLLFTLLLVSSFSDPNDNDIPFIGSDTTCGLHMLLNQEVVI